MTSFSLSDFDFDLPPSLIAQTPAKRRSAGRLLVVSPQPSLDDRNFSDLPTLLEPGDVVVFNDTRVIRARLQGVKETGGKVEVMVERIVGAREALAQIRSSHAPRAGQTISIGGATLAVIGRDERLFHVRCDESTTIDRL